MSQSRGSEPATHGRKPRQRADSLDRSWAASAAFAALVAAACATQGVSPPITPPVDRVELTVLGAASLRDALEQAKTAYEAAAPGTSLALSTDSSAALRTQIEQGAPADVFLSADTTNPRALVDGGLTHGDVVDFAGNRLTIVVPADNPARLATPADLARPGVKVLAAGAEVPITTYAEQAVDNLARLAGYPPDFAARYAANIVSREDNVSALVAKVGLGEADAGIVYVTDARAPASVATIDIPQEANVRANYAGVVVKASRHHTEARAFLDWLAGRQGQAIFADFGFLPPRP